MVKDKMDKKIIDDIGHCGNIASSALVLATERSCDIKVPVVVTLTMLKKLCQLNIDMHMENVTLPPGMGKLAVTIGLDVKSMGKEAQQGLEELIDEYFEWQKMKRIDISGA